MRQMTKFALTILATFAVSSAFAQCANGGCQFRSGGYGGYNNNNYDSGYGSGYNNNSYGGGYGGGYNNNSYGGGYGGSGYGHSHNQGYNAYPVYQDQDNYSRGMPAYGHSHEMHDYNQGMDQQNIYHSHPYGFQDQHTEHQGMYSQPYNQQDFQSYGQPNNPSMIGNQQGYSQDYSQGYSRTPSYDQSATTGQSKSATNFNYQNSTSSNPTNAGAYQSGTTYPSQDYVNGSRNVDNAAGTQQTSGSNANN